MDSGDQDKRVGGGDSELTRRQLKSRTLISILIVVWVGGTLLLSLVLLSGDAGIDSLTIEPQSYYSERYSVYGIGMLQFTFSTSVSGGPVPDNTQVSLLVLTEGNFKQFVSGKNYSEIFAISAGYHDQRHGNVPVIAGGAHVVIVNHDVSPVTISLEYDMRVFFSALIGAPMVVGALLVYVVLSPDGFQTRLWKKPPI